MLLTPLEFRQAAAAVIVLGRDGSACVFKPVRGSTHLSFKDFAQVSIDGGWKAETIPTPIRNVYERLSSAYENYLYYKGLNCDITADTWLNTADAFASRICTMESLHIQLPKVITIFVERRPMLVQRSVEKRARIKHSSNVIQT